MFDHFVVSLLAKNSSHKKLANKSRPCFHKPMIVHYVIY